MFNASLFGAVKPYYGHFCIFFINCAPLLLHYSFTYLIITRSGENEEVKPVSIKNKGSFFFHFIQENIF